MGIYSTHRPRNQDEAHHLLIAHAYIKSRRWGCSTYAFVLSATAACVGVHGWEMSPLVAGVFFSYQPLVYAVLVCV